MSPTQLQNGFGGIQARCQIPNPKRFQFLQGCGVLQPEDAYVRAEHNREQGRAKETYIPMKKTKSSKRDRTIQKEHI